MCYFLVQKDTKNDKTKTQITNNNNEDIQVIIKNRAINPITEWSNKTENIITNYVTNERNNIVYNRGTSEKDYAGGKYKVVYTPEKILHTNKQELAPAIGIKKIVLFESKPFSTGFSDFKGEYGVGPHTFYVPFETNTDGKLLERFFKSDIYKTLVKVSITSQYLKTSLLSYLNLNKILLKIVSKTKKAQTTEDIYTSENSVSKTIKHHTIGSVKKTKNRKKGGKNKTLKVRSIFKLW
jgi:hypothetical protein